MIKYCHAHNIKLRTMYPLDDLARRKSKPQCITTVDLVKAMCTSEMIGHWCDQKFCYDPHEFIKPDLIIGTLYYAQAYPCHYFAWSEGTLLHSWINLHDPVLKSANINQIINPTYFNINNPDISVRLDHYEILDYEPFYEYLDWKDHQFHLEKI